MVCALQVGNDPDLLKTRAAVLESAGLSVISAGGASEALKHIASTRFHAAILCHSLSASGCALLAAALRRHSPSALVLLVAASGEFRKPHPPGIDGVLEAHPQKLIRDLRALLKMPATETLPRSTPVSIGRSRGNPR